MVISVDKENREFAFVRGNRPTNAKVIRAKTKSLKDHGQLSPITVAFGERVIELGGHLVDLQGQEIPDNEGIKHYAVLDSQHRLIAYLDLKMNLDDLVVAEPLNADLSIAELIAQMNICTTTWKGRIIWPLPL